MRTLILALVAIFALFSAGCCSSPSADPPSPAGLASDPGELDLQPVIAEPVRGACLRVPLLGCKICVGLSCDAPEPVFESVVMGQPVARPAAPRPAAPPPCESWDYEPAYVEPAAPAAGVPCGSASDTDPPWDYRPVFLEDDLGVPPALADPLPHAACPTCAGS